MKVTVGLNKIQREITLDTDVDENAVIAQVTKACENKTPLIFTDTEQGCNYSNRKRRMRTVQFRAH